MKLLYKGISLFSFILILVNIQPSMCDVIDKKSANHSLFVGNSANFSAEIDRRNIGKVSIETSSIDPGNCFELEVKQSQQKQQIFQQSSKVQKCQQNRKQRNSSAIAQQERFDQAEKRCNNKDVCPTCSEKNCTKKQCQQEQCICPVCEDERSPCVECMQSKCEACKQPIKPICPPAPICKCEQTECKERECPPEKKCPLWDDSEHCTCPHCEQVDPCPPQQIKQCPENTCLEQKTCPSFECHVDCNLKKDQISDLEQKNNQAKLNYETIIKEYEECKNTKKDENCETKIAQLKVEINKSLQKIVIEIEGNLQNLKSFIDYPKLKLSLEKNRQSIDSSDQYPFLFVYKQLANELLGLLKKLATQTEMKNAQYQKLKELTDNVFTQVDSCQKVLYS